MKAVSLIIPFYKQKSNLNIILKSVKYQTFHKKNFEVILVNDGSDADISEELSAYQCLNIKFCKHETNLGRSAARNTGAKLAQGKVLVFVDADRFLKPTFLEEHFSSHQLYSNRVVIGDIVEIFEPEQKTYLNAIPALFYEENHKMWNFARRYNYAECVINIFDDQGRTSSTVPWIAMFSGNFSIAKEVYEFAEGFDETFTMWGLENMDFGKKLYDMGVTYFYNKRAVNFHIFHKQIRVLGENSSLIYFQKKYANDKQMLNYFEFLNGTISLRELHGIGFDMIPEIYYNDRKIGPRYQYIR